MTDWKQEEITSASIDEFLRIHGKNGVKTLSLLGRNHDLFEFASSDIGTKLLRGIMVKMEQLLEKIIDGKATAEETMEYGVNARFFNTVADKVSLYLKSQKKVAGK